MKKKCNSSGLMKIRLRKKLLTMKFFVLFFLLSVSVSATTYSQDTRLTLSMENVSLTEVFSSIRKNTSFTFIYNVDDVRNLRVKSLNVKDATVQQVLDEALQGLGFIYQIEDNVIVIRLRDEKEEKKSVRVRGFVYDVKKQPLPGVTIKVVGINVGTSTNAKGWFAIDLPLQKGTLEFSFVGFKKKQVEFTAKTDTLRIVLEENLQDLNEVQVIAYGSRKKRDVVSAISSVKAEDIKEIPAASFTSLLQGRMAGVEVVNVSGSPGGGGTQIYVRGYNSLMNEKSSDGQPLYVIDGVPMHSFTSPITGTNALAELDPNSIESIEVLKDAASAALYGSRAGNGVVLITTKKGKIGQAQFSANVSYTASVMPEFPEQLGGREERRLRFLMKQHQQKAAFDFITMQSYYPVDYNDAYRIRGSVYDGWWGDGRKSSAGKSPVLQDSLNPFYNNQTNWWKSFFRTGKVLNANIQANGGTERIRYMVGMGYYTESGINYGSDFKRANFIANLSMKPAKRISFDTRINLTYTDKSRNLKNNSFWSAEAVESMTVNPAHTTSLLLAGGVVEDEILEKLNGTISRDDSYRLMFNAMLGVNLIEGLKCSTSLGLDFSQNNSNVFEPSYLDYRGSNKSTGLVGRNISITQENLVQYNRSFYEEHNLEVMLGTSYNENQTHEIQGYGTRIPGDNIYYVDASAPGLYDFSTNPNYSQIEPLQKFMSSYKQQVMMSYLGRVAYNYRSKYLLEATYRRDGSSVFGEDVRWANFPSVAVGWTFSEENFMQRFSWLNLGKFRVSWGTSGRTLSDPYLAHGVIENGSVFMGNQGMTAPMINRRVGWEESDQYDFGLDLDMFNYRLKLKMDYYYKHTKDMLYEVDLPGDMFKDPTMWQNAMEVSNEGVELELLMDIFRESKVSWRMRFNISRNWNMFKKSYSGTDVRNLVIGRPLSGIYLNKEDGFVQNQDEVPLYSSSDGAKHYLYGMEFGQYFLPGMRKYIDIDGDGSLVSDTYYAYSPYPKAHGGWTHEIKWRGFSLNLHFAFMLNRKMINQYRKGSLYDDENYPLFVDYRKLTFWEKEGDNTDMPRLGFRDMMNCKTHVESVNSLRLSTLNLGYDLPRQYVKKVGLEGGRFFFTGENLFLWTNYSGMDPEVIQYSSPYDTLSAYPLARKFTLGLTLNF